VWLSVFFPNDGSYIRSIVENTESHTLAGTVISSADEDVGDSRTYHIDISRGTGGDVFEVICKNSQIDYDKVACQAASAQLRLRDMKSLDFELTRSYKVYLVATDVGGLSASIAISINILDKNEEPSVEDTARNVGQNAQISDPVGEPIIATDPDIEAGDDLEFSIIQGNNHQVFKIGPSDGQITINKGPSPDRVETQNLSKGCKNCHTLEGEGCLCTNCTKPEWCTCPANTKRLSDGKCITNE
jgi:hypothetical protein